MNRVEYISNMQPPYNIKRYKYYKVSQDQKGYYILSEGEEKIYYSEQEIKDKYRPETSWEEIFKVEVKEIKEQKFKKEKSTQIKDIEEK